MLKVPNLPPSGPLVMFLTGPTIPMGLLLKNAQFLLAADLSPAVHRKAGTLAILERLAIPAGTRGSPELRQYLRYLRGLVTIALRELTHIHRLSAREAADARSTTLAVLSHYCRAYPGEAGFPGIEFAFRECLVGSGLPGHPSLGREPLKTLHEYGPPPRREVPCGTPPLQLTLQDLASDESRGRALGLHICSQTLPWLQTAGDVGTVVRRLADGRPPVDEPRARGTAVRELATLGLAVRGEQLVLTNAKTLIRALPYLYPARTMLERVRGWDVGQLNVELAPAEAEVEAKAGMKAGSGGARAATHGAAGAGAGFGLGRAMRPRLVVSNG